MRRWKRPCGVGDVDDALTGHRPDAGRGHCCRPVKRLDVSSWSMSIVGSMESAPSTPVARAAGSSACARNISCRATLRAADACCWSEETRGGVFGVDEAISRSGDQQRNAGGRPQIGRGPATGQTELESGAEGASVSWRVFGHAFSENVHLDVQRLASLLNALICRARQVRSRGVATRANDRTQRSQSS